MNQKSDLEDNGTSLLAQWAQSEPPARKIEIALDVRPGDAVALNAETGRYEKADLSRAHGIYDGYAVVIKGEMLTVRHSLLDGNMAIQMHWREE